jgi:hypothetical protein
MVGSSPGSPATLRAGRGFPEQARPADPPGQPAAVDYPRRGLSRRSRQRWQTPGDDPNGAGGRALSRRECAKGSQRAQRLFTALITTTERDRRKARESELEAAIVYKVAWERELERRKRFGITAPDPLPHPDHIVIDVGDGTVAIKGPATKEEQVLWDIWSEQRTIFEKDLREQQEYLLDPEATERDEALQDIAKLKECIRIIDLALNGSRPVLRFLKSVSTKVTDDEIGT